jgi:hypothetical protein
MAHTWVTTVDNPAIGAVAGSFSDPSITHTPKHVVITYTYDKESRVWTPTWAEVTVMVDTPGKSVRDTSRGTFDLVDVYNVPGWLYTLASRYRPTT